MTGKKTAPEWLARQQVIIAAIMSGMTWRELGRQFGYGKDAHSSCYRWLSADQKIERKKIELERELALRGRPATDEELIAMLRDGLSVSDIRGRTGRHISSDRLKKLRTQTGIKSRKPEPIPDAAIRAQIIQGASESKVRTAVGRHVSSRRIRHLREELVGGAIARGPTARVKSKRRDNMSADKLYAAVSSALSHMSDRILRDDAISEMYLAALEGQLALKDIRAEARRFSGAEVAKWQSRYGPISLDEITSDEDFALIEKIDDPSALDAFNAIFEEDEQDY